MKSMSSLPSKGVNMKKEWFATNLVFSIIITFMAIQIFNMGRQLDRSHDQTDRAFEQTKEAIKVAQEEKALYDSCAVLLKQCLSEQTKYQVNWK